MAGGSNTLAGSRLGRLARRSGEAGPSPVPAERCELCDEPIPEDHRHLLDLSTRDLRCACRACSVLFDRRAAGGDHYRLVPERRLRIVDFELDEVLWEDLHIPVEMAFFFRSTQAERVVAFYPSPMGATESLLELDAWNGLAAANPVLDQMEEDVEALLVNRLAGAGGHWLVPIDECYSLVGLIRTRWKGLSGGKDVWLEITRFFEQLDDRSRLIDRDGVKTQASSPAEAAAGEGREKEQWRT